MDQSIGDILNGEPEQELETVVEQMEEPQIESEPETIGQPRGADGKFLPKMETGVETPAAEAEPVPPTEQADRLPQAEYVALKAIRDENKELKAAIARLEQRTAPQAKPQQPPVDFWDDPQSFLDQRLSGLGETLLEQFEQRQTARRMDASEQAAKAKYTDYDEAFTAFEQAVQLNPRLAHELAMAPDPGEFAYARGKTALEIQRVGSIDELRKQIRSELEAEARAMIQPRQTLPSTTAADSSVGARTGPLWTGPKPIGEILS